MDKHSKTKRVAIDKPVAKPGAAGYGASLASKWAPAPKYSLMFYARDNKAALRRCFGDKKQIFQFGAKGASKAKLMQICEEARQRLSKGDTEEYVEAWVLALMA